MRARTMLLATILAAAPAAGGAEGPVRFELCGRIASAEVGDFGGSQPWAVLIQLKREAGEAFATLTRENVGRQLEITHGGHALLRATIQGEIRSGNVSARYATQEDAERAKETLAEPGVCQSHEKPTPQRVRDVH